MSTTKDTSIQLPLTTATGDWARAEALPADDFQYFGDGLPALDKAQDRHFMPHVLCSGMADMQMEFSQTVAEELRHEPGGWARAQPRGALARGGRLAISREGSGMVSDRLLSPAVVRYSLLWLLMLTASCDGGRSRPAGGGAPSRPTDGGPAARVDGSVASPNAPIVCESHRDCPPIRPLCGANLRCVQCRNADDCGGQTCDAQGLCQGCQRNSDCPRDTPFCNNEPSRQCSECATHADCPGALPVCGPYGCHAGCVDDSQCRDDRGDRHCGDDNFCNVCLIDAHCPGGTVCSRGEGCVPGCASDAECVGATNSFGRAAPHCQRVCSECATDADCPGDARCTSDEVSGAKVCAICNSDADCDGHRECVKGYNQHLNGRPGCCFRDMSACATCKADVDCPRGYRCFDGNCIF